MAFLVSRNGQTYGPYTLEDLQRYVASGNVLLTDLVKSDEMPEWIPVSQVLSGSPVNAPRADTYASGTGAASVTHDSASGAAYTDPPNLHWALVLLFGLLTCGIFNVVYDLVQAAWLKRIQPNSKALLYYILATVFWLIRMAGSVSSAASLRVGSPISRPNVIGGLASLAFLVLLIVARFSMRQSLEEHYNGPEAIGLRLSAVMTFFFGGLYFQYHFNRINEIKRGLVYR